MECAYDRIMEATAAALSFRARDESGQLYPSDQRFLEQDLPRGVPHALRSVCELNPADPVENELLSRLSHSLDT